MTGTAQDPGSRAPIDRHLQAMYPAIAMLAAIELDLFTPLAEGPMNAEALAGALGVEADRLEPLLYALVLGELLTVESGRFANAPAAARYLVRGRPGYIGGAGRCRTETWLADLRTARSIQSGRPSAKRDFAAMSEGEHLEFLRGEHDAALAEGRALAETLGLDRYRRLLDVAGGAGGLAIGACEACPRLRATVAELPAVVPIARRFVAEAGLAARIEALAADLVAAPAEGSYDAAVLRNFLQVLSRAEAARALRHVARSLAPGSPICIAGWVLDDSRLSPVEIAVSNYAFLNIYDAGRAYTEGEYRAWLAEAGFAGFARRVRADGGSLITARKA